MNFSFGTPTTTTASTGFSFGAPATSMAPTAAPTLGFGAPAAATTSAFSFGSAAMPAAQAGTAPKTTAPTLSFGGITAQPVTVAPSATAAPTLNFGVSAQSTSAAPAAGTAPAPFSFSTPAASKPAATSALVASLAPSTSTTQSTALAAANQLNFCQLEEFINKWTLELEEQEKTFTNQATQVNAWDKVLLSNGDKIIALNEAVEKVKAEQEAMEQELEFITAQHAELEECILPLEEELSKTPQVDVERGRVYSMAETLDSQLKQMSEDLKEIVEHLNEANKFSDPNDPMVQIGRILNAHMGSLQWIESSTALITNRLDEISKMQESLRKDNERSFRMTYYDN